MIATPVAPPELLDPAAPDWATVEATLDWHRRHGLEPVLELGWGPLTRHRAAVVAWAAEAGAARRQPGDVVPVCDWRWLALLGIPTNTGHLREEFAPKEHQ